MFTLKLINVGAVGTAEIAINPGMNVLLGANGAGKSTIVNAFYFALTGESLEAANIQSLVRWGFSSMKVTLEASDFTVERTVQKNSAAVKHKLTVGSSVMAKKDEVNNWILRRFGIVDLSAFRSVYFVEQFRAIDIINATNSARSSMLLDVFGFRKFEKIRSAAQTVLGAFPVSQIGEELMKELEMNVERCEQDKLVSQAEYDMVSVQLMDEREAKELAERLKFALTEEEAKKISAELQKLQFRKAELDVTLAGLVNPAANIDHESAGRKKRFDQVAITRDELAAQVKKLKKEKPPKPEKIRLLLDGLNRQLMQLEFDIKNLEKRKTLVKDGKCPLTKGAICADLKALTNPELLESELEDLLTRQKALKKDMPEVKKMLADSERFYEELKHLEKQYSEAKKEAEDLSDYASFDLDAYRKAIEASKSGKEELVEVNNALNELKSKINDLEATLTRGNEFPMFASAVERIKLSEALETHKKAIVLIDEKKKALDKAVLDYSAAKGAYDSAVEEQKKAEDILRKRDVLTSIRTVLHRDAVPRMLLAEIREELNDRLAQYTDLFSFPYDVVWEEDGSLMYDSVTGGMVSACRLSGGQKYVLALIHRCVLADMLNSTFPVLVLDEPTTGLDVANRKVLAEMLSNISVILNRRGMSLSIPTHDDLLSAVAETIIKI